MVKEYKNRIQKHTYSIPALVQESVDRIICDCAEVLSPLQVSSVKRIVITGCGYSYAAALAIKDYLIEITRIPISVLPAIEVSRFSNEGAGDYDGTVLIAISNSGEVSRLNEAVMLYRKHHARVIALTANLHAPIAMHADYAIDISSPSIGSGLPLRGYCMTILALLGIGYQFAGAPVVADVNCLKQAASELSRILPDVDGKVIEFLEKNPQISSFEFVGSGYERGLAFLGKIQMLGQAGIMSLDEDSEQWCHCNFFMANPERIGTILFYAKSSPAASRNSEVLSYMEHLNRPVCVVTDDDKLSAPPGTVVIQLPEINNLNAGILEMAVPSLLTGYYCDQIGETYSRGFRDQWDMFKTGAGTCESQIIVDL